MRSDATRSGRSSPMAYRSRTLPDRMNDPTGALARDIGRPLQAIQAIQAIEAADDLRHVAQERRIVEAGVQLREAEVARHLRVHREELPERPALVGGSKRGPLHDRVRVLATEPAILDQRDQDPAAGMEPQAAVDV